jgi:hypothetical protein
MAMAMAMAMVLRLVLVMVLVSPIETSGDAGASTHSSRTSCYFSSAISNMC